MRENLFKLLSAAFVLGISLHSLASFDPNNFKTKDVVRIKLWVDGLDSSPDENAYLDRLKYKNRIILEENLSIPLNLLESNLL